MIETTNRAVQMNTSVKNPQENQDTLTSLAHKMIRMAVGDDFDPFMVQTGNEKNLLLRSCFYYSVLITPRYAVLFDNEGRGGMCMMSPDEIRAVWEIDELLASQDLNLKDLNEKKVLPNRPIPKAIEVFYDLEESEKVKGEVPRVSSENSFSKIILLSELVRDDIYLGLNLISKFYNPEKVVEIVRKIEQREQREQMNEWISNCFDVRDGKTKEISVVELKDFINQWVCENSEVTHSSNNIQTLIDSMILRNTSFTNLDSHEVKSEIEVTELKEMLKKISASLSVNSLKPESSPKPVLKVI